MTYDEVLSKSVKYFKGNELAAKVWVDKYALRDNQDNLLESTPDDMHRRLAREFARIEKDKFKEPLCEDKIYSYFKEFEQIIPQGSPMYGIGNIYKYITLSNCYLLTSPLDSYSSIIDTDKQLVNIAKRRGGNGIDLDNIRPAGTPTKNSARTSTGIVPFMERYSNSTREVGQNSRRGALMLTLSVHHPQILDFVNSKKDKTKVTGANISVKLTNEFLKAVEQNGEYEQRWPLKGKAQISQKVKARPIWEEIVANAHASAEPGLLFFDNILSESPADCYKEFGFETKGTNPSLRKNTKILTKDGIRNIQDLVDTNFQVLNYRQEWQPATCFISGKDKQLMKITFSNNQEIYCTPEHQWPILQYNSSVLNNHTGKIKKKETQNLSNCDKIYFPTMNGFGFNSKHTKEDGFVCGWNLGDGWITQHKTQNRTQFGFVFSQEDNQSNIGTRVLSYTNKLAKIPSKLKLHHGCYQYTTTDLKVKAKLSSLGLTHKSNGLPSCVWGANDEFIHGLIDGLFSSDGSIGLYNKPSMARITLTSVHRKLVLDLQKLLSFFGIRSSIKKAYRKTNLTTEPKLRYDLTINGLFARKFADIFTLSNIKKEQKLAQIRSLDFSTDYKNNRDYLVVKSVEYTDIYEDVYDISVDDDTNTFITECGVTGNCSELPLSELDSCRLMVINLFSCVENPYTSNAKFNLDKLTHLAEITQRLMDDMVDLEIEAIDRVVQKIKNDPEPQEVKQSELTMWNKIKENCQNGRRTGTGITALGDVVAALGIKYDSNESIDLVDKIYQTIKLGAYSSSVEMAKEIGPFKVWNYQLEKDNPFLLRIKTENESLWNRMKKYGRRNIALLTTAPTGSISLMAKICDKFGTTSGIEPCFKDSYTRRKKGNPGDSNFRSDFIDQSGDHWQEFEVYHSGLEEFMRITGKTKEDSPYKGSCADELDWKQRVKLQSVAQRHVDHAISSTVNIPNTTTKEQVGEIYEAAWKSGCKGMTVYRDGCRTGVLVKEKVINKTEAPKRPKTLPCEVHHINVKGKRYMVFVGLLGEPYEIMAYAGEYIGEKSGTLTKLARGVYKAVLGDTIIESITQNCTPEEEAITRLVSTSLRHGSDISYVVQQLEKTRGELNSFTKSLARALKKYIKDGTKVSGEECPTCGGQLQRVEGCIQCTCGYSKCG